MRGTPYLSVLRELLDTTLRRRIADRSAVTVLPRHEVSGLVAASAGRGVEGVRLRERGADWLDELGSPAPVTERIDARLGYSSRYFRRPADGAATWKAMCRRGPRP
ncbi:hypothetical protein [Streptomyces niveus]|uniref:hypothetical protein n=1 Tax=Streptomyces niveus TaxID=193462 RepID=UPI0036A503D1